MQVVRTRAFERSLKKLGATASDLAKLEAEIATNPAAGDVIPGLQGVRKVRFAMKGRGKRGGGRAVYLVIWNKTAAYLVLAYDKSVQADLSETQRKMVLSMAKELSSENYKT
jgi:hypothetical protein